MKLKIAFIAAMMMAPTLGAAAGCSYGHEKQAMSCAEGSAYDSTTNSCLPIST